MRTMSSAYSKTDSVHIWQLTPRCLRLASRIQSSVYMAKSVGDTLLFTLNQSVSVLFTSTEHTTGKAGIKIWIVE